MPRLPEARAWSRARAALALATPAALVVLEALRAAQAWDWTASVPARVGLVALALAASMTWVVLLARPPHLEGDDLAEARRLHEDAYAALERAARLAQPPGDEARGAARRPLAWAALIGVAFVLAAGALWAVALSTQEAPPIHEHARLAVYADGERLDYGGEAFDLSRRGHLRGHLHAPDGETLHVEGAPGLTLGEAFERTLGGALTPDAVRLDDAHGGRAYRHEDVRLLISRGGVEPWAEVAEPFAFQPRDGDLVLLVLGAPPRSLPEWAAGAHDALNRSVAAP